jgi:hypothetical protein
MSYLNIAYIKAATGSSLFHALFSVGFRLCDKEQALINYSLFSNCNFSIGFCHIPWLCVVNYSFSSLSHDRSKASSKVSYPHNEI